MIYMETNIILQPGKMAEYLEAEKAMYPMIGKFGMKLIGSWRTTIGNTNEFIGLFAYEDMGQLEKSSMAMRQDMEYQAAWKKMTPSIMSQTRKIMMPTPMSPLK